MDLPSNLIPGLDVVGRGLYLRPHQPYELRSLLFRQDDYRSYASRETKETYSVPAGYQVDDSPPLPNGVALNLITVEESWERFHKQRSLDVSVAAQSAAFSVSTATQSNAQLRSNKESYYAVRSSFVALWSLYLERPSLPTEALDVSEVPVPFDPTQRQRYEAFFQRYGTHFVKRAWVGGKAEIVVRVAKSSNFDASSIQAGLSASFVRRASQEVKVGASETTERLQQESQCTVMGRGGVETHLAEMASLDKDAYDNWINTIRDNPQTIELELAGVWTLLGDSPKVAQALMLAYRMTSSFEPLSSVLTHDDDIFFIRGRTFFAYNIETQVSGASQALVKHWPFLDEIGFDSIDAAFRFDGKQLEGHLGGNNIFMFRRDEYVAYNVDTKTFCAPRKIAEYWPGVSFSKIDAALATDPESIYFFAGSKYIRFNGLLGRAEEGYPEKFQRRWLGVSFDRIDAAIYWDNGKIYFFRDDHYIRYDIATLHADPGYPKPIVGNYVEDWNFFD